MFERLQAMRLFGAPMHVLLVMHVDRRAFHIDAEAAFGNIEPGARGLEVAATFGL